MAIFVKSPNPSEGYIYPPLRIIPKQIFAKIKPLDRHVHGIPVDFYGICTQKINLIILKSIQYVSDNYSHYILENIQFSI